MCFILNVYVFLSWYGKWTAIDLYLASWIRNLSVLFESAHWRFNVIHWDFWLDFFIALSDFLEFWIAKTFCRNFVFILTFSFYEFFAEVLCAAFCKIIIIIGDYHKVLIAPFVLILNHAFMLLYWRTFNNRRPLYYLSHFVIKLSHFVIPVALCNNTCRTL